MSIAKLHNFLSLKVFLFGSLLIHGWLWLVFTKIPANDYSRPVSSFAVVSVALADSPPVPVTSIEPSGNSDPSQVRALAEKIVISSSAELPVTPTMAVPLSSSIESDSLAVSTSEDALVIVSESETVASPAGSSDETPVTPRARLQPVIQPPLRTAGEFLQAQGEKFTYRISMLGIPVGSALLTATSDKAEVRITLKVVSNSALSSLYPIDDLIETRHLAGNFIISKIKQREGNYRSDKAFTIFLRDKNVFWLDRQTMRSSREQLPNSDVVDLLSGFYYLRNRQLTVGTSVVLDVYDSDDYVQLPIAVLRREVLPVNGVQTAALVVRPQFTTGSGVFKRTGPMLIWLSDDDKRVPLKIETSIPLGKVTAELVSAEVERGENPAETAGKVAQRKKGGAEE
jgi:Protein of unknown function (DUF3108)